MLKKLIRTTLFFFALAAALVGSMLLFRGPVAAALEPVSPAPQPVQTTATAAKKSVPNWQVVVRGSSGKKAELYSSQGDWMQQLAFEDGQTLTMAMPPGEYQIKRDDGVSVGFRLAYNASVTMLAGQGWTDGEILYVTDAPCGSIKIIYWLTQDEFESGDYEICLFNLRNGDQVQSTALYFTQELEPEDNGYYCQTCSFEGLSPGTYELEKDGQAATTVVLTREEPSYTVVLGGDK